jgi:hypothetical protein
VNEAEQDVLGTDVVVAEHPGLFLSQDNNPPRPIGKPREHWPASDPGSGPQWQRLGGGRRSRIGGDRRTR